MDSQKLSVEEFIRSTMFPKTGEAFLNTETQADPLYSHLRYVGEELCKEFVPGASSFYFIDGVRIQACAIHKYQVVLVYRGMLEFVFRIASMMAGSNRRMKSPEDQFYEPWRPSVQSWLAGEEFDWEDDRYWWLAHDDYRLFFDAAAEGIFKFLVLHELGHLHNMHGTRREPRQVNEGLHAGTHKAVDDAQEDSSSDQLAAHAREIVADTFAFQFLFEDTRKKILLIEELQTSGNEAPCIAAYSLSICYVAAFFWSLGFILKVSNESQEDRYPSHLFRLASIEAASLEHGICGMNARHAAFALHSGMDAYVRMLNPLSESDGFVHWRLRTNEPAHHHHYESICQEVSNWANMAFGIRDEFWTYSQSIRRRLHK